MTSYCEACHEQRSDGDLIELPAVGPGLFYLCGDCQRKMKGVIDGDWF